MQKMYYIHTLLNLLIMISLMMDGKMSQSWNVPTKVRPLKEGIRNGNAKISKMSNVVI